MVKFTKMHALGNDYIYIDCFEETPRNLPELSIKMSDRHFGIGGDGVILIKPGETAPVRMEMYNPDGTVSNMCGNALRSIAKYVYDKGIVDSREFSIETGSGVYPVWILTVENARAGRIMMDLGVPLWDARKIPAALDLDEVMNYPVKIDDKEFRVNCVNFGNPHCVIFQDDIENLEVRKYGHLIENHELFPERANVEFVEILGPDEVRQRTWERGTGETYACGSGASSVFAVGNKLGLLGDSITVNLKGGQLFVEYSERKSVLLTGTAEIVFEGVFF